MSANPDVWTLVEPSFDVRYNRHFEGLFAIGSGPLQQRAAFEEGLADDPQNLEFLRIMGNVTVEQFPDFKSRVGTYLPGVSGPHPTCLEQMLNLPAIHGLILYANGERLDMRHSRISDYRRQLDLRTGKLSRSFTWDTPRGGRIAVAFERFISAKRKHVMALRCTAKHLSGPAVELRVVSTLDADVRTNGYDHFEHVDTFAESGPIALRLQTNGGDEAAAAALLAATGEPRWSTETSERWIAQTGTMTLDEGAALTIDKFAALLAARHARTAPLEAARRLAWDALGAGYEQLAAESDEQWAARWRATDVEIEGDPESQLALRASLYHMLRAVVEGDRRVAIDAKGAAGEAYCGRYFWDTEMFMLPLFLYTRPEVGRALAAFRIHSLPGARRNAQRYGYAGAKYGWESSASGDDNCPNWQYADHEVHVTADVAYGLWHAFQVDPQDVGFLAETAETLAECARYWRQRVWPNPQTGEVELLMVMGPDEYTPFSRNNAYTNFIVALTLNLTVDAWRLLRERDAEAAKALAQRIGLEDAELTASAEIAAKLRIPYDAERRLVLQSDDFFDYEPLDFERWWPDRTKRIGAAVSQERLYRSQVLKQADVVQLMTLAPHQFDAEQIRVAYDLYEPLTSHDSSLSKSMHAIVLAWLGREEQALRFWDESVGLDLEPGEAAEGIHAACAGANWQVAVFGFAGVRTRMQSDILRIDPHLPQRWSKLRFTFVWDRQPLTIAIRHGEVEVEHRGDRPVAAQIAGQSVTLAPGEKHVAAT